MRRDRCRHADGDPARSVRQEVGEGGRKDDRLFLGAVVVRLEVDGVLVETDEQLLRDRRQPRFGVTHGGGVIAVDIAEIALPVHERVPRREILREADEGVVDGELPMRVIFADRVADHARALLEGCIGAETQDPHRPQDTPVNGLQPVARIRQRALGDSGQRIGEVALGQRLAELLRTNVVFEGQFTHGEVGPGTELTVQRRIRGGCAAVAEHCVMPPARRLSECTPGAPCAPTLRRPPAPDGSRSAPLSSVTTAKSLRPPR